MSNQPSLTPEELSSLSVASSDAVSNSFSSLKRHFQDGTLLSQTNPYFYAGGEHLKYNWSDLNDQFVDNQLLEYLSVSVLVHAYDGWSYLAQAMQSMIRGDLGAVRHLSYYAELRAAISILASQGIGIYGNRNVVLDSSGVFHKFSKKSTHTIAWLSLEEWSKSSASGALFGNEIVAFSRPLHEWLNEFERTTSPNYTGASFINTWGLDLAKYSGDRSSRNEVSYQVNLGCSDPVISPREFYDFVKDVWESSDPSMLAFSSLDKYLLKSILKASYRDKRPVFGEMSYHEAVEELCENLDAGSYAKTFLQQSDRSELDLSILRYAKSDKATFDDYQYLDMFSRAFLLLRISSACITKMLKESGVSVSDFEFWWTSIASSSGLVEEGEFSGDPSIDIENLWLEVEDAIAELDEEVEEEEACWKRFMRNSRLNIEHLSRLEKIAFFGMSRF